MANKIDILKSLNFWDKRPSNLGYIRYSYIQTLEEYLGSKLIKVLIGQRRVGKSFILRQLISFLVTEKNVKAENILYINFENRKLEKFKDPDLFTELVEVYFKEMKPSGKVYFFFDEIQELNEWEKIINSFLADINLDVEIFITGSNSKLLSSDLATYITGRYITKKIHPLTFKEYLGFLNLDFRNSNLVKKEYLLNYLNESQIPEMHNLNTKEQKINFIRSLKDSIIVNDIVKRFNVKDIDLLEKIFFFLVDNFTKPFSINSVHRTLKTIGISAGITTISNYILYLEHAFLIEGLERYTIKGKRILEGAKKYYLNDLGFRNYLTSSYEQAITKKLENYIFKCLDYNGYSTYVGYIGDREIDFIAEKDKQKLYVQATYQMADEKVIEREYGNLEKIHDSWGKVVVSMDDVKFDPRNGIEHIQAWEFEDYLSSKFHSCS